MAAGSTSPRATMVVVMGVSGSGKSTFGAALAEALGARFLDADDLHPPANRQKMAAGIALDVTVGYGDTALDVPEPLRQAMRLLIAHWYENRGLVVTGAMSLAALPATVAALIAPYRMVSL